MDFTSIIGFIAGIVLVAYGIMGGGNLIDFYDLPSVFITFGGTIAATLMSFPIGTFKYILKHFKIIATKKVYDPKQYISIIVDFAQEARRKGTLALEDKVQGLDDKFLASSMMLIVDAIEPEKTKQILENELDCLDERHAKGWQLYEKMASYAPAFGMIGTLIGLVNMLKNLNLDSEGGSKALSQGMSTALITTFYGVMFANMVLMPIANKLKCRHREEMICKEIIVEGVLAIQSGENPRHIEERLYAYINGSERTPGDSNKNGDSDDNSKSNRGSKRGVSFVKR